MAGKNRKDAPRDIGDAQQAGYMQPGENFQPRNRGEMEDAQDEGAARVSRELARDARDKGAINPGPQEQTPWEARVEPDSEVSRRGLVNPPPEE